MFENLKDYYPTPPHLINKMLENVDFRIISTILEPSAGKGHLVDAIIEKFKSYNHSSYAREERKPNIDCIEIDFELRSILQGKGLRVVHDDFLTYETHKRYDAIICNLPFSEADKHLLKILEMQKYGGIIVAVINGETLKNPYSNTRKDLVRKLEEYNANIEYIENAFIEAERKTSVEIALIKITIENTKEDSIILDKLKQEEAYRKEKSNYDKSIISGDFIEGIVQQYNFEIKAGLHLISEYENLKPTMLKSLKKDKYNTDSILLLEINEYKNNKNSSGTLVNEYIKKVRYKYWKALFDSDKFTQLLTSNLIRDYINKINELVEYDFSQYNIKEVQIQISKDLVKGVEDTILALFEEFSHKHSFYSETSSNIHYYNGWKGNKAHLISKRVIIPLSCFDWANSLNYMNNVFDKLRDIEKVFNYLDGSLTEELDLKKQLENAQKNNITKNIMLKYASCTFYKKGTCHITFLNEELLKKFNIFGSQKRGWLPPSYGKTTYKDMTKEEQEIINEFEGEESYSKVIKDTKYYIYNPSTILMIE